VWPFCTLPSPPCKLKSVVTTLLIQADAGKPLLEVTPRVRRGMDGNLLRSARHHVLSAHISGFRNEIDDPVGAPDNVQVVLRRRKILVVIKCFREEIFSQPLGYPQSSKRRKIIPTATNNYRIAFYSTGSHLKPA